MNITYKKYIPIILFIVHFLFYLYFSYIGYINPIEIFNVLLLVGSLVLSFVLFIQNKNIILGCGIMMLLACHGLIGHKIAPDALTSGSILMTNILTVYIGFKIFEHLPLKYGIVFVTSYLLLFFIFIKTMTNAEPLFLLSLLGLCATIRNFKLLAYFFAIIFSFSFCQPYAWESLLFSFLFFKIIFSKQVIDAPKIMILFCVCGLLLVCFVLLPVVTMILEDDPTNIITVLKEEAVRSAIFTTFLTATFSTLILIFFCIPFAYFLARTNFYGKSFVLSLIDLPIIIPQSAAGIALIRVFGEEQFLGELISNNLGIHFNNTIFGICLAQIFVSMPFIIKSSMSAFEAVPKAYEQIALTLGASHFSSFYKIAIPMASRGIFAGIILAWARAAGEFGAILFIAPFPETAPIAIFNRFTSIGFVETAPLVTTLLTFSVVLFFLLQLISRTLPVVED